MPSPISSFDGFVVSLESTTGIFADVSVFVELLVVDSANGLATVI